MLFEENQAVVEDFLTKHPDFEQLSATEVLAKQGITIPAWVSERFGANFVMLPHLSDTDGFFGAVLQKKLPQKAEPVKPETPTEIAAETTEVENPTPAAKADKTSA